MTDQPPRRTALTRSLDWVERTGNALPDPVTLFAILIVLVVIASVLAAGAGVSVQFISKPQCPRFFEIGTKHVRHVKLAGE